MSSTSWSSAQGRSGEVCAGRLADGGLEVALVESDLIGGECSYYACMPSKALLRPGELLAEVRRVPGAAEAVGGELDAEAVLARRDEVIHDRDDSSQLPWLEDRGIELVRGRGALDGERRVAVGDDVLSARRAVVVGTGTTAAVPPIDGLRDAEPWTNREATTAKSVPESLRRARRRAGRGRAGAGVVHARGDASRSSRPRTACFPRRSRSPASRGRRRPARDRCRRRTWARRRARSRPGRRGHGRARGRRAAARRASCWSRSGAGRGPTSSTSSRSGVETNEAGYLEVDDQLRVGGSDWLYAIGDVNGRALLTHMGKYQARIAADAILGKDVAATRGQGRPAARRLHRAAGRGGRADAREGSPAGHRRSRRRRADRGDRGGELHRQGRGRAPAGSSSTSSAASSSARRSSGPRSPTSCTRRRSPSSARCRWSGCGTRSRAFPRAARSGSSCSRNTGSERRGATA